jgi:hypothetical protein
MDNNYFNGSYNGILVQSKEKEFLEKHLCLACFCIFCYIKYYGAPIQFRSYGAEPGKMILTKLGASPGTESTSPADANRSIDSSYSNPFSRLLRSRRENHRTILH